MTDKNTRRRNKRREVLPGFPWEGRFKKEEEIAAYFAGDTVVCLLCGQPKKSIGQHLVRIHNVTPDEYKERYNLLYRRGLTSSKTRKTISDITLKRIQDDPEKYKKMAEYGRTFLTKEVMGSMRKSDLTKELLRERNIEKRVRWSKVDFIKLLRRDFTFQEAIKELNIHSHVVLRELDKNSKFSRIKEKAIRAQSFSTQARGQALGDDFIVACQALFLQGMSDHEIARRLGVTAMTCNNRTKAWRKLFVEAIKGDTK